MGLSEGVVVWAQPTSEQIIVNEQTETKREVERQMKGESECESV